MRPRKIVKLFYRLKLYFRVIAKPGRFITRR